jgi:hypothetical protein
MSLRGIVVWSLLEGASSDWIKRRRAIPLCTTADSARRLAVVDIRGIAGKKPFSANCEVC